MQSSCSNIFACFIFFDRNFSNFVNGRFCGVNLVGDVSAMAQVMTALEEKRPLEQFLA